MRCEKTHEFLSDYIEGTLERPMVVAVEAHLQQCGACAADVSALRQTWAVLDAMPAVEPPPDLAQRIAARALPARPVQPARSWWQTAFSGEWLRTLTPVHAVGFAAAAGLVALGLLFPVQTPEPVAQWGIAPFRVGEGQAARPPVGVSATPEAPSVEIALRSASWENNGWVATVEVTPEQNMGRCAVSMTPLSLMGDQWRGRQQIDLARGELRAGQPASLPLRLGAEQGMRAVLLRIKAPSLGQELRRTLYFPIPSGVPSPRTLSLALPESDVHVALARLAEAARVSLVVDPDLGGRLPIQLQNVTLEQALTSILEPFDYRWERIPGGYAVVR